MQTESLSYINPEFQINFLLTFKTYQSILLSEHSEKKVNKEIVLARSMQALQTANLESLKNVSGWYNTIPC